MRAALFVVLAAVAVSAIEFQSIPNGPFGAPIQLPIFESVVADFAKLTVKIQDRLINPAIRAQSVNTLAVTAPCQAAVDALAAVYVSGSCQNLPALSTATQATMTAFCTSDCVTNIQAKVDVVTSTCTGADASIYADVAFADNLRRASSQIQTLCTQDGDTYCFSVLKNVQTGLSGVVTATAATLDAICTPCTVKMIIAGSQYGDRPAQQAAVYLDLICMKRGDPPVYCAAQLQTMSTQMSVAAQTGDFSPMCHPCIGAMFGKIIEISTTFSDDQSSAQVALQFGKIGGFLRAACQKKDGQLCINVITSAQATISAEAPSSGCPSGPAQNAAAACEGTCKAFVLKMQNVFGCCLPAFISSQSLSSSGTQDTAGWLKTSCGISIGSSCSTQVVKASFRITNLRFGYYLANKAIVEAKLRSDLALFAGVSAEDVTLESVSEVSGAVSASKAFGLLATATGGINVKYTVIPVDEAQAAQITASIVAGAAVALPNTASLPLDAREQPAQAVGVDTSASTAVTANGNGAAAVTASLFSVVLAAAFAVFAARQ